MAVTIARTAWIDDDGSGTTGTVINNAIKTELYGQIDSALALVAQLTGGNSFGGTQTFTGQFNLNGNQQLNGNLTTLGSGRLCFNNPTDPSNAQMFLFADSATRTYGIGIYSSNTANNLNFIGFLNSGVGESGRITQTGASSVSYATTSDQRLKIDDGLAVDVTALRAVRIHDFTWKTDERRDRGVFAQEAVDLFPRAVVIGTDDTTADGSLAHPWMTDYSRFVPDLIVGWQQHAAAIAELQAALAAVRVP